jgi:NADH-quinone oxidoreductase subunit N
MDFPGPPAASELWLLLPELVLIGGGLALLLVEMLSPRRPRLVGSLAVLVLLGAIGSTAVPWAQLRERSAAQVAPFFASQESALTAFHGNLVVDGFALTLKVIVLLGSALSVLMALRYAERFRNPGEFFALLVFATSAASLLTGAADLLMIYLTVEFLSIASYIVVGYLKFQPRSTEAALKYFLYGAITAAVMLYGLSFLYGMGGVTNLYPEEGRPSLAPALEAVRQTPGGTGVLLIALVLAAVGFAFKAAMAPFHQWVPDVYDGAPLPVMAWLSVASKAAGMAVFIRVFTTLFAPELWVVPIAVLSALTMTVGNLAALPQQNVKRMLAYSSIAHAGYTLMGVAGLGAISSTAGPGDAASAANAWQTYGVAVYLATYVFMNLGALAVVMAVYNQTKSHRIEDYAGLSQRAPGLAWLMVFFLLSLAGIPPTAGFWGKFVLFAGVLDPRIHPSLVWLAVAGFINSVISVYYYWNVVRAMFLLNPAGEQEFRPHLELRVTLAVAAAATLAIFLFAGQFMTLFMAG